MDCKRRYQEAILQCVGARRWRRDAGREFRKARAQLRMALQDYRQARAYYREAKDTHRQELQNCLRVISTMDAIPSEKEIPHCVHGKTDCCDLLTR